MIKNELNTWTKEMRRCHLGRGIACNNADVFVREDSIPVSQSLWKNWKLTLRDALLQVVELPPVLKI